MGFKMVIVPPNTQPDWPEKIRAVVSDCDVQMFNSAEAALDAIVEADAAYGNIGPELLQRARKLRWIQAPAAAPPAGYYYKELIESNVVVTNQREIYNDHIGAHIMAFILAFARGLHHYIPHQLQQQWRPNGVEPIIHLPEAAALIIGVGGIGSETARLCAAFGMTVLGVDARRTEAPPSVKDLRRPADLHTLLPQTAFLINIGRGACDVLDDLVAALRAGDIAGAGLDVYEIEPLPPDHPLWTMPGVLLTPHVAGVGPYLQERRTELLLENCQRFNAGHPLHNVVDKANWF